jgi:hypothetical protein
MPTQRCPFSGAKEGRREEERKEQEESKSPSKITIINKQQLEIFQ